MGGMKMKHFMTEEWIDFVNQVSSPKQQEAMRGNTCYMAKGSQLSGSGGQLPTSRDGCSNRQGGIRCAWPSHATEGTQHLGRSAVRQFFATNAGRRAFERPGNKTNALSR